MLLYTRLFVRGHDSSADVRRQKKTGWKISEKSVNSLRFCCCCCCRFRHSRRSKGDAAEINSTTKYFENQHEGRPQWQRREKWEHLLQRGYQNINPQWCRYRSTVMATTVDATIIMFWCVLASICGRGRLLVCPSACRFRLGWKDCFFFCFIKRGVFYLLAMYFVRKSWKLHAPPQVYPRQHL